MRLKNEFLAHTSSEEAYLVPSGNLEFRGLVKGNESLGEVVELLKIDTTEAEIVKALREKYLSEHGSVISANVGVSMLPLLRQKKDLFFIGKKGTVRCRVGDVVLYRRKHQYVLHRVISVTPKDYVILGDNCTAKEYGVQNSDILALMTSFVRNGREHSVNEFAYRLYSFVWLKMTPLRIFLQQKIFPVLKGLIRL